MGQDWSTPRAVLGVYFGGERASEILMHGNYQEFINGISGFLGGYYLFLAAMNAVMAFYLWHHKHRIADAVFWVVIGFILAGIAAASMGGIPPGLPQWFRDAVNNATGPVIYSVGTTSLLVLLYLGRRFFVKPMVA